LQQTPRLASLFTQGVATGPTIRYPIATTRNAPADAATVEDQQKPGAEFAFDDGSVDLEKLAAFVPISEEMIEDSPVIARYINVQLALMVSQAEEYKLATEVYASATGVGISADVDGSNGFDAIAGGILDVQQNAHVDPDAIFINPVDWWGLKATKSTTSGDYYSGGPFVAGASNPWGIPAVASSTAPAGFPLVGNFRQGGTVWRKCLPGDVLRGEPGLIDLAHIPRGRPQVVGRGAACSARKATCTPRGRSRVWSSKSPGLPPDRGGVTRIKVPSLSGRKARAHPAGPGATRARGSAA
jgi:hypothetical protein